MSRLRLPLEVFLWSRAAIWLFAIFAFAVFEAKYAQPLHFPGAAPFEPSDSGWAVDLWGRWDGGWYYQIAHSGYTNPHTTTAFFPAYPMTVRVVGWIFAGHILLAGVIVSLLACGVAFVLLDALARTIADADTAQRSLVYLAVFPAALFLGAVYAESLYLMFSVGAFLAATRGRWTLAGIATGLGILTRPLGVVLLPALVILAWRAGSRRRAFAGLATSLPIAAVWPLWLWAAFGHPLEFLNAESEGWGRHVATAGPFSGIWKGSVAAWNSVLQLILPGNRFPFTDDAVQTAGINLESFAAAVLIIVLGIIAWRRLGAAYGVFVLASIALPLSSPGPSYPLLSMPRFALGVFPIFIALATVTRRPRTVAIVIAVFAMLLGLDIARWVDWQFVA
jgi:hypothetical protein